MITTKQVRGVRTTASAFDEMYERWEPLYDLLGGTKTMRNKKKWLPQEPKESDEAYQCRVRRTFLYNAYKRTVKALVGGAFMRPVKISNVPKELEYLVDNADGCGQSITSVAATLAHHLLITGRAHPLVDMPSTEGGITKRQFDNGVRPYLNPIDPRSLIGWQATYNNGVEEIIEIRLVEQETSLDENYFEQLNESVRIIRPGSYEVHHGDKKGKYHFEEEGTFSLDYVPIVPIYEEKIATMVAEPPLEDLAWLNLRHWQSSSDQNNILHVVRVPLLLGTGFAEDEIENLVIGANSALFTNSENADLKYVEHQGNAIEAGRKDLEDLEKRMAHMGSDILTQKSVERQTASARQIDKAESLSTFQVILRNLERGLEDCFKVAGDWIGVDASEVQVSIGDDLTVPGDEANSFADLMQAYQEGVLTETEFFSELKRRGTVAPQTTETIDQSKQKSKTEETNDVKNRDDTSVQSEL